MYRLRDPYVVVLVYDLLFILLLMLTRELGGSVIRYRTSFNDLLPVAISSARCFVSSAHATQRI
jgi:hypothetical protein